VSTGIVLPVAVTASACIISAGALLFTSRPANNWSGSSAALFCAALLVALSGATLITIPGSEGQLLMEQLALFAAVPMISAVLLLSATPLQWDRPAWGRVLLGVCAVFELARRSDVLQEWLIVVLVLAIGALGTLLKVNALPRVMPAMLLWCSALGLAIAEKNVTLIPALAVVSVFFVNRQDISRI